MPKRFALLSKELCRLITRAPQTSGAIASPLVTNSKSSATLYFEISPSNNLEQGKKMQTKYTPIMAVILSTVFVPVLHAETTANSNKFDTLPIIDSKNNNAPFKLRLADGSVQNIRLQPLTQAEADTAMKISASLQVTPPSPTYTVTTSVPNINNFYGTSQLPVLNQQDFGTCVTFSSSAALSYLTTGTTTNVSPLYILDQGYIDENGFKHSGWDGLANAGVLLQRVLPKYENAPGQNQGYYPNYNQTQPTYVDLSKKYQLSGEQGNLTAKQLKNSGYYQQLANFQATAAKTDATLLTNVVASNLNLSTGNANNTKLVKQALDAGNLVLMDFNVYDANVSSSCKKGNVTTTGTAEYTYNSTSGTITQTTPAGINTNAWVNPTGCLLGGHQIWVVSYGTDTAGNTLFIIRNSWGNSGDQGQYYMSDFYLNNAASYAAQVSLKK